MFKSQYQIASTKKRTSEEISIRSALTEPSKRQKALQNPVKENYRLFNWNDLAKFGHASSSSPKRDPDRLCGRQRAATNVYVPTEDSSNEDFDLSISADDTVAFEAALQKSRIYSRKAGFKVIHDNEPDNLEALKQMLAQPRSAAEEPDFQRSQLLELIEKNHKFMCESNLLAEVIPFVMGYSHKRFHFCEDQKFTFLQSLGEGLPSLVPGMADGERRKSFDPRVLKAIGPFVISHNSGKLPNATNFFLEVKSSHCSTWTAMLQMTLNVAAGARAMRRLRNFPELFDSQDKTAHTLGLTYLNGEVEILCAHMQDIDGVPHTFTKRIKRYDLLDEEDFRDGMIACRNARDWARDQRQEAIRIANRKVREQDIDDGVSRNVSGASLEHSDPKVAGVEHGNDSHIPQTLSGAVMQERHTSEMEPGVSGSKAFDVLSSPEFGHRIGTNCTIL